MSQPGAIRRLLVSLLLLLAGCTGSVSLPYHTADGGPNLCPDASDALAARQCARLDERRINGYYCLTAPEGDTAIRHCWEFYTKLVEVPAPTSSTIAPAITAPVASEAPLYLDNGVYVLIATINGSITLAFTLDSGAGDM